MKLSDYIADFLAKEKAGHCFGITGGAIVHVFDSIAKNPDLKYICPQHEQAAAMAADAYARITGNFGTAIATSGPGATNLLTGTCCSYFDSIPVLIITGQVPRSQLRGKNKSRQVGFQETDIVNTFRPNTKYSVLIENPERIKYELEKALYIAKSGRPGPVLLDIPDDVQRAEIEPEKLEGFVPEKIEIDKNLLDKKVNEVILLIEKSERPVVILGGGIRESFKETKEFVERLGFPVALTWAAMDLFPRNYPLSVRDFGVTACRTGNFTVQNSDLVLALGTRLDTHEAGSDGKTFAREAKKIVVDLDSNELEKYASLGIKTDVLINFDVKDFLNAIKTKNIKKKDITSWLKKIDEWKIKYPICPPEYFKEKPINPYVFMDALSKESKEGDIIITDAGCNVTWTMQSYPVKPNQRLFSSFNHSPMGYSLPAAIGAAFASKKPVICIIGDGGIQMNIQELATIQRHNLPIKIFLMNNHGYGMMQQTQETWLGSRYVASDENSGLAFPDFIKVSHAYGIPTETISTHEELNEKIRKVLNHNGPMLCNVEINPKARIHPKLSFGKPIEDSCPFLPKDEFLKNMIIKPVDCP